MANRRPVSSASATSRPASIGRAAPSSALGGDPVPRRREPQSRCWRCSSRPPVADDVVEALELPDQLRETLFDGFGAAVEHQFRIERFFVRIGNAGKELDFALERLLVQPFDVTLYQFVDRAPDIDLEKAVVGLANLITNLAIRRDGGRERDPAV